MEHTSHKLYSTGVFGRKANTKSAMTHTQTSRQCKAPVWWTQNGGRSIEKSYQQRWNNAKLLKQS